MKSWNPGILRSLKYHPEYLSFCAILFNFGLFTNYNRFYIFYFIFVLRNILKIRVKFKAFDRIQCLLFTKAVTLNGSIKKFQILLDFWYTWALNFPPAREACGKFRNFTRLAVFSGCLSVCDVHIWAQWGFELHLLPHFCAKWNIFRFLERGIFSLQHILFSQNFDQWMGY